MNHDSLLPSTITQTFLIRPTVFKQFLIRSFKRISIQPSFQTEQNYSQQKQPFKFAIFQKLYVLYIILHIET